MEPVSTTTTVSLIASGATAAAHVTSRLLMNMLRKGKGFDFGAAFAAAIREFRAALAEHAATMHQHHEKIDHQLEEVNRALDRIEAQCQRIEVALAGK